LATNFSGEQCELVTFFLAIHGITVNGPLCVYAVGLCTCIHYDYV